MQAYDKASINAENEAGKISMGCTAWKSDIRGLIQKEKFHKDQKRLYNNFIDVDNVFLKNLHQTFTGSKRIWKRV